jgi:streptogrisin C
MKRVARMSTVATILLVASLIAPRHQNASASAASTTLHPSNGSFGTVEDQAFERDVAEESKVLGVPLDEMRADLERQELVGEMNASLKQLGPDIFGGLFVDYSPTYRINVLSAPGQASAIKKAISTPTFSPLLQFVYVTETDHTEGVLISTMNAVGTLSDKITSLDLDLREGKVLVTGATQTDVDELRSEIDATDLPIPSSDVVVEVGGFTNDTDSYGGLAMNSVNGNCTSGFSVSATGGGEDGVTDAAHCANSGVTENGISITFVAGKWGDDQDVQWFHTPNMNDTNLVKDGSSSTRTITSRTGRSQMFVSEAVCKYGRMTGYSCGQIVSVNANPGSLDNHTYNATFIRAGAGNLASQGGDSGGPWFFGHAAFGIHKGNFSNGDLVFMAQNYMSVLGIVVKIH